jgi:AmiR/NasT family two-component response regulator
MLAEPIISQRPLRVALADDEPYMRRYLQTVLPRLGYEIVVVAQTGRELVDGCRETLPDLIISDVQMPEMDGLEAVAAVYDFHPIPIIVISGHHGPELIERTVASHVMAYLIKPVKISDIDPVISQALRRFAQLHPTEQEGSSPQPPEAEHDLIERALEALMRCGHQDQAESRDWLNKLAREREMTVSEVAQSVVLADEALRAADEATGQLSGDQPPGTLADSDSP